MQGLIPEILTLGRLRQEDCLKFKVSLGYRVGGSECTHMSEHS